MNQTLYQRAAGGAQLQIVQTSMMKRIFQLKAGEEVLYTMSYPKWYSTEAVIEGQGERWTIFRERWFSREQKIRHGGDHLPTATFAPSGWGKVGTFSLPNGERLEYSYGVWKNTNELFMQNKVRIASLKRRHWYRSPIDITLDQENALLEKHPWVLLAVFRIMMERSQSQAAAAT